MKKQGLFLSILFFCNISMISAQIFSEQSSSIGFEHDFRARLLMGGGAAFFDYDLDGDEDIYVTSGYKEDRIFRNNGDGTFSRVLDNIGLGITYNYNTMGVTTGDIDNDGDRDIFIATWERFEGSELPDARSLLFLNNGDGTFTEIGEQAGITHEAFAMGAAFLDYNKDGYLDVYVMNHILEANFTTDENGAINGIAHDCYPNFLYLNNGDLTFTEVAAFLNVDDPGCTIAAAPTDYDMDGDLDLYLANDFGLFLTPNSMYRNNYPMDNFTDVSVETGSNVQAFGMGIAAGDFDHDHDFDYYTTNIGRNILIENIDGNFVDITTEAGVENATVPTQSNLNTTGWGTAFFDVDNDTWEDLYVANGRIPALPEFATATFDPDKLYMNNGDKTFTDVTTEAGLGDPNYVHGMAYGDYDEDGDLDIVTVALDEFGGHSKFYVNQTVNDNHYIQFKLEGVVSNRDAYGSKVWVFAGGEGFVKELYGGGASHASQHSSVFHFGLAQYETVDSVRIEWTNGHVQLIENPAIDTRHYVVEDVMTSTDDLIKEELGITVTPNPFTDEIRLYADSDFGQKTLQIRLVTIDGRILMERSLPFNRQASLEMDQSLPSGIYLLQVRTDTHWTVKKLMKK